MAVGKINTMQEGMVGLLASISDMKIAPDADLQWLIELETKVLQKIREPMDQMSNQLPGGGVTGEPAGPTPGGMPPPPSPMMGGGAMGVPAGAGVGARGMRTEPAMPNPDEMRRMMGGGQ